MMRVETWRDGAAWDAFVATAPDASITHLWAWREVMDRAYGHPSFYLAALDRTGLCGVLPLTLVTGRLVGRHMVSIPFMDHGGICGALDPEAGSALVREAQGLARTHRAVLGLRSKRETAIDLPRSLEKVLMVLSLEGGEEGVWKRIPSKRRGQIRKGQRHGLTASIRGADALGEFYRVMATNMRDLGSPVHSVRFFRAVMESLGERARIILVRSGDVTVGAGLLLADGDNLWVPWSSSLRRYFSQGPNQVLYWESMRHGIAEGFRTFDFGRSSVGSGTFQAKREWGAEPEQLYWHYHPADAGPPEEDVQRLAWGVRAWRRLPLSIANLVGPAIRRGIPN
jgi:serine/alanine adding enzyme